jgi:hypothetical protein
MASLGAGNLPRSSTASAFMYQSMARVGSRYFSQPSWDFPVETNGQALVEAVRMIPGHKHLV